MAFNLSVSVPSVEYRGMQEGQGSRGRWVSLVFEDRECNQISCSVPGNMQADVDDLHLQKGDICDIAIRAVARADGNSYVQLRAIPNLHEEVDY